jgi:hypothetical protein
MASSAVTAIFSRRRPVGKACVSWLAAVLTLLPAGASSFSLIQPEDGIFQRRDGIVTVPLPPLPDQRRPAEPSTRDFDDEADPLPDTHGPAHMPGSSIGDDRPVPDGPATSPDAPGGGAPQGTTPFAEDDAPLPVSYDDAGLPRPVRDLRERLMEIARSGDVERLRPYLETGAEPTALSPMPIEGDPIDQLKAASGDGDGVELMAILLEVLESGHVRMDPGEDSEIFVWPYFTQVSLEALDKRQLVELFELVTAGDYQRMLENGAYDFYRVGISPAGRLEFFLMAD